MANPVYKEDPAGLDLVIIRGNTFGPMRITPAENTSIAGRTYAAAAYKPNGSKVADFTVAVVSEAAGTLDVSMTAIESAKLLLGDATWDMWYTSGSIVKTVFSGNLTVKAR